jgi:hypothetical protein
VRSSLWLSAAHGREALDFVGGEHAVVEADVVEDAVEFIGGRDADEELVGPASDGVIGI